jgi:hypothetical protein
MKESQWILLMITVTCHRLNNSASNLNLFVHCSRQPVMFNNKSCLLYTYIHVDAEVSLEPVSQGDVLGSSLSGGVRQCSTVRIDSWGAIPINGRWALT